MTNFDILILAIALSMDAMIVSFSNGLIFNTKRLKKSLMLALTVGFFQFIMPIFGFFFAQSVTHYLKPYSHWVVFGIFFVLGLKFIKDSYDKDGETEQQFFKKRYLFAVGIATSIDALFAGVTLSLSGNDIFFASTIIGLITFLNSMLGFWSATCMKHLNTGFLERAGGSILIILGLKVLFTAII